MIVLCNLLSGPKLDALIDEADQLRRIFGKSVVTARRNDPQNKA